MKKIDINELLQKYTVDQLLTADDIVVIDVRDQNEYQHEHIEGAKISLCQH